MTDNSIVISSNADFDSVSASLCTAISGLTAGAALPKLHACYIDANGVVQLSVSTVTEDTEITTGVTISHSRFDGFVLETVASGQTGVCLYGKGLICSYGTELTPGAPLFVGAVAGHLEANPVATNDRPVARVISTTDVILL